MRATAASSARERLLDGARERLRQGPWADVTMAAVAEAAGVSRQTLYNTFGTREQLGQALLLREVEAFLGAVEADIAGAPDAETALGTAFATFLQGARENPLIRAIVLEEDPELLAVVIGQGVSVVGFAAEGLASAITARWPAADAADVDVLSSGLVRLAISYAAIPVASGVDVPADVQRLLGPFLRLAIAD